MKKVIALSFLATLSTSALANVDFDLSQESNNETTMKAGFAAESGFSTSLEGVFTNGFEKPKEVTLDAAWKLNVTDNFYVQPQAAVTVSANNAKEYIIPHTGDEALYANKGTTYKVGVKTGYDFDSGVFVSARYRLDSRKDKLQLLGGKHKFKNQIHRTDLTVGYNMDLATISANWIHKDGSIKLLDGKAKTKADEFEFKAVSNIFGDLKPYAQYTVKTKNKFNGKTEPKADNVFKVGMAYNF